MQPTTTATDRAGARRRAPAFARQIQNGDRIAHFITLIFAGTIILITVFLFYELYASSYLTREKFGWRFLTGTTWDPVALEFGALTFIYGTFINSFLALVFCVFLCFCSHI